MKIIKKIMLAICPLVLLAGLLAGCHTTQGAVQDVTQTGNTITNVPATTTTVTSVPVQNTTTTTYGAPNEAYVTTDGTY